MWYDSRCNWNGEGTSGAPPAIAGQCTGSGLFGSGDSLAIDPAQPCCGSGNTTGSGGDGVTVGSPLEALNCHSLRIQRQDLAGIRVSDLRVGRGGLGESTMVESPLTQLLLADTGNCSGCQQSAKKVTTRLLSASSGC